MVYWPLPVGLDVECVHLGGATFCSAVTCESAIPFGAIGALGWNKSCHHLCGFLAPPIELGYLFSRIEE